MEPQAKRLVVPLVLFILLAPPVAAQEEGGFEGSPTDFLPLQVGNQWTYEHWYVNGYYNIFEIVEGGVRQYAGWGAGNEYDSLHPEWTRIRAVWEVPGYPLTARYDRESSFLDSLYDNRELTLEITHTEMIEGHTYFVFGKPSDWPPVPTLCLAGQKVRFSDAGVLLVRQQEQDIPLYDFSPPYTPFRSPDSDYVTKDYTTLAYPVLYDAYDPVSLPLAIRRFFLFDRAFVSSFSVYADLSALHADLSVFGNLGGVHFLANYGLAHYEILDFFEPGDFPSSGNTLYSVSAVIDGQTIEYPSALSLGYSHVQPTSWGQLKARHGPRP